MLRHLHRLHARAESHGRVSLRKTTSHAAQNASREVVCAECLCVVLGFGSDEEEDGALGRGLEPGPWDEALVDCVRESDCRWAKDV